MNLTSLTASIDELKAHLPIPFVLAHYGFQPASQTAGRLHYRNPWRDDTSPSLDVFTDEHGVQRAGDYAEGFNGSVLDVIGRQLNTTVFKDIIREARALYAIFLDEGWDGPSFVGVDGASRTMDADLVEKILDSKPAGKGNAIVLDLLADNPGIQYETLREFGVLRYRDSLAIPYPDGKAIRFRHKEGKSFLSGSKAGLYHHPEQTLAEATDVLLVEGESDTWAAWPVFEGMVVGIPGVGHQPARWMEEFEGKNVSIAFDGDSAGRRGAMRWAEALMSVGCNVLIVPLPDRKDVASLDSTELERLLGLSRRLVKNTTGLETTDAGYAVEGRKEGEIRLLSNWTATPLRVLDFDNEKPRAFEVQPMMGNTPAGDPLILTADDMGSSNRLHRWASQFSGSWWGSNVDHQKLRAVIEEQASFLPVDSSTSQPGLRNGTFVYPGGTIGEGSTVCVPDSVFPLSSPDVYHLTPTAPATPGETVQRLLGMHQPGVMQPLLAWFAVAPLRSLYRQFPPLFVPGRAGSGKTTLVQTMVSVFSGINFVTNLTSTTPYALALTMGGTNAYVTWFDEYRPGARRNTMEMMDQLLRDAYNGAPSRRGGLGNDKSVVTTIETTNPLVVSGEDFADEQSHRDRLIKVFVPRDGKGDLPLWTESDTALAHDYLLWLTERPEMGYGVPRTVAPPVPDVEKYQNQGLSERQAYNLAILDIGWRLLSSYVFDRSHVSLPKADWSHLMEVSRAETESDPVAEALQLLFEGQGQTRAMWYSEEEDVYYVSSGLALPEIEKMGLTLPFTSARAMTNYLVNDLGGQTVKRSGPLTLNKQVRYVRLANLWTAE